MLSLFEQLRTSIKALTALIDFKEKKIINENNQIRKSIDNIAKDKVDAKHGVSNSNKVLVTDSNGDVFLDNRTHYTETIKTTILEVNDIEITVEDGEPSNFYELGVTDTLVEGKTYYVTLNGVEYTCIARQDDDCYIIGNDTIYGDGDSSNNELFICVSYSDGSIYLIVAESGTYNIKIETKKEYVHQLDEKYILDIITRIYNDIATNINSPKNYTTYKDISTGKEYAVYVDNGQLCTEPIVTAEADLIDFEYIVEDDGTYTLTAWKGTLNGEPSTEIVVPDRFGINL